MQKDELAERRWKAFPSDIRKNLEGNVYCSNCGVTKIVNYDVYSSDYDIVLKGQCNKCHDTVVRVID
ncbi:hypothetical protein [Evansella cellulosilytica]|uniref:Uncharacterized protein n=1 Tax=Evansella cellulosilytica (strain ATCC 21833 / DSM 2522 / FERM P-1141 / JCM 9156 / N-4) TaxID=649639 RepID=E6TUS1_EVAC2|nr:hypothetical protein [Evansella cellulosilytica]ADU32073.1 hypothetical protein Bcell_3834 [Evansella cellulosilytica DSM 2522]